MTSMDQIHRIRDLYYVQDKSLTEIASMEKLDWRTVRKYVDMEDFSEAPPSPDEEDHSSKLDPFKPNGSQRTRKLPASSAILLKESTDALRTK